ncbi:hypothetical protein ABZ816_13650 [Actinosynnema sp. NPDC047251]|uniref:Uncharacterized protein n=1 Tax=Saccharothrix espanaensis (strain ATCC 51144 / DSM 44229 / JCM 9112 / NBRC 15066 / NRRL 15764) TaxID=1179773 RepID=K0KBU1_SACES|nr:hypothetical protein [Saccharothrix espanaensis]CCH35641.1 hypothetical protein BN6_84260 [Saccharothrix espanaensis DSM 44229]
MEGVDGRLSRADQALTESVAASVDVERALAAVKRRVVPLGANGRLGPEPGPGTVRGAGAVVSGRVLNPLALACGGEPAAAATNDYAVAAAATDDFAAYLEPDVDSCFDFDFDCAAAPPVIGE